MQILQIQYNSNESCISVNTGVCVHFPIAGGVDRCSIPSVEGRKCTPKCIEPPQSKDIVAMIS